MKEINENVSILNVDVNDWGYDDNDNEYPKCYEASVLFYGKEYYFIFSTDNLKRYREGYGLDSIYMEGDSDLYDSMASFFEDNDDAAGVLAGLFREEWDTYYGDYSPYDYLGEVIEEETEQCNQKNS